MMNGDQIAEVARELEPDRDRLAAENAALAAKCEELEAQVAHVIHDRDACADERDAVEHDLRAELEIARSAAKKALDYYRGEASEWRGLCEKACNDRDGWRAGSEARGKALECIRRDGMYQRPGEMGVQEFADHWGICAGVYSALLRDEPDAADGEVPLAEKTCENCLHGRTCEGQRRRSCEESGTRREWSALTANQLQARKLGPWAREEVMPRDPD